MLIFIKHPDSTIVEIIETEETNIPILEIGKKCKYGYSWTTSSQEKHLSKLNIPDWRKLTYCESEY